MLGIDLFSVLRKKEYFDLEARKQQAKEYIRELMVLTLHEAEYIEAFEKKEYKPELLFDDKIILENIKEHPMALGKMEQ